MDLSVFKDPVLNGHGTISVAKMITHKAVMAPKVKLLDGYLEKLHQIINEVATEEENWDVDTLLSELDALSETSVKPLGGGS